MKTRSWLLEAVLVAALAGTTLAVAPVAAAAADRIPGQFIAKMYSEALGRMPDQSGWSAHVNHFAWNGCTNAQLATAVRSFYTSSEFLGRPYDAEARLLTLYRGALNREPDQGGFDHFAGLLENGTRSWSQVVDDFAASAELARLTDTICGSDTSYHYGTTPAPTLTPAGTGFAGGSGRQLQALLDAAPAGGTVYLARKAVVRVDAMLVVPPGKTLATTGAPSPHEYANQGRLVRASAFAAPVVRLQPGARLTNVWVDGQRGAYTNYLLEAINVQTMGGSGTQVSGSKISNAMGWSSLQAFGSAENLPCGSTAITDNLITAYSSEHDRRDGVGRWTDGLSIGCENSTVTGNEIIDATDVGIVLFRASPAVQRSTVRGNLVLSAGNSAYGAIGMDGLYDKRATHDFTGAHVSGNAFWTAPGTHFDIGLAVGTRSWFGNLSDAGVGVSVRDNTTRGHTATVGTGIAVTGMHRATVQGNDLRLSVQPIGSCPHVNFGVDADGYASEGDFQPGAVSVRFTNPAGGGCVGH